MPKSNDDYLTIAIPKGRVLKQLVPRFKKSGIDTECLIRDSRELIRRNEEAKLRFLLLKPDDVPTYVEYGAADIGVVGRDVLLERAYDLLVPVDLGIGRCQMMVCGKKGASLDGKGGRPLRVATKFPNIAESYFHKRGQTIETIFTQGSVELAPLTGLADVIVDLVETGETLKQNGLVPLQNICDVSSVLVANRVGFKLKHEAIETLMKALR